MIIIIAIFIMVMFPVIMVFTGKLQLLKLTIEKEEALQIAEAGINYYQWHLAHFPNDYKDGTGSSGPYVHNYTDYDTQQNIGQFSLVITPPLPGSTIVTVESTGWNNANPGLARKITARFGIASLAKYAFLSNDVIWIGSDETVNGQFQSNNGVRFDGIGNAPIQSAKSTYTCPSSQGSPCPAVENGVWGSAPQSTKNFWQFPVPAVDFSSITSDLAVMKTSAQTTGIYLPPSNAQGYSLVFNSDGTVSVYKVDSLLSNPVGWDTSWTAHNEYVDYDARTLQFTNTIPANGIIYIEDKTWVEGTVNGRVTVVASQLPYNPSTAPTIYIPNNIVYATKDGSDVLGLIAQKDIVVTYHAPTDLEVDAAIISQNGAAQFFYYAGDIKNSITIFGAIMTYNQWTWTWVDGSNNNVAGYSHTYDNYDSNLLYAPPPSFPLSSSSYQLLSWTSN
ncbi:MAG: hypothetical protein NTY81_03240 [Candidatus Staskawiczbacteria bacterium]|nr:hypothetical protein [Candidatus Staskawiczbacteria bacterium]